MWTGWPVAADGDGVADAPVDGPEPPPRQVVDGPAHAATSATATATAATPAARAWNRCLMTTTMLRRRPVYHPGDDKPGETATARRWVAECPVRRWAGRRQHRVGFVQCDQAVDVTGVEPLDDEPAQ